MPLAAEPGWDVTFIAAYVVRPPRSEDEARDAAERTIGSTLESGDVPIDGLLAQLSRPMESLPFPIIFLNLDPQRPNRVRELVRSIALDEPVHKSYGAYQLAMRLAAMMTGQHQPALMVLASGQRDGRRRVLMLRLKVSEELLEMVAEGRLAGDLLQAMVAGADLYEQLALFEWDAMQNTLVGARADDRTTQANGHAEAELWVERLLLARFSLTDTHGSMLLARALRQTVSRMDTAALKGEVVAAAQVMCGQDGRRLTLREAADLYLPEDARAAFLNCAGGDTLVDSTFRLEGATLRKMLRRRVVEIDGKFTLSGPLEEFDERVIAFRASDPDGPVTLILEGRITLEGLG